MVTVESGSTLPLLSDTVPVMPPRVCCARAHRENCKSTASKEIPSFIFFVGINVTSSGSQHKSNATAAGRGLQFDYLNFLRCSRGAGWLRTCSVLCPALASLCQAGKLCRQMYAN